MSSSVSFTQLLGRRSGGRNPEVVGHQATDELHLDLGAMSVDAPLSALQTLSASGNFSVGSLFSVTAASGALSGSDASFSGTLGVQGTSTLAVVDINGAATLNSTLDVVQGAVFSSTVDVQGALTGVGATFSGNISAADAALSGDLSVVNITGREITLTDDINAVNAVISQDVSAATATVSGAVSAGSASITGAAVAGSLQVQGDSDFDGDLVIADAKVIKWDAGSQISVVADSNSSNYIMTIDPAATGAAGKLVIQGDLDVQGTTTTINSTAVEIADFSLHLAKDATSAQAANGAGIFIREGELDEEFIKWSHDGSADKWAVSDDMDVDGAFSADSAALTGALDAASASLTGALSAASAVLSGDLSAQNATLSADLTVVDISGNEITLTDDINAVNAVLSGNLSGAAGTFTGDISAANATLSADLSAANATLSGALTAASGDLSGALKLSALSPTHVLYIDANQEVAEDALFTWDDSAKKLTVGGELEVAQMAGLLSGFTALADSSLEGSLFINSTSSLKGQISVADVNGNVMFGVLDTGSSGPLYSVEVGATMNANAYVQAHQGMMVQMGLSAYGQITMPEFVIPSTGSRSSSSSGMGRPLDIIEAGRHFDPAADISYDLGYIDANDATNTRRWRAIYAESILVDSFGADEIEAGKVKFQSGVDHEGNGTAVEGDMWYYNGVLYFKDDEGVSKVGENDLSALEEGALSLNADNDPITSSVSLYNGGSDHAMVEYENGGSYGDMLKLVSPGPVARETGDSPTSFLKIGGFDPATAACAALDLLALDSSTGKLAPANAASHYMLFGQAPAAYLGAASGEYDGHFEMQDREFTAVFMGAAAMTAWAQSGPAPFERVYLGSGSDEGKCVRWEDIKDVDGAHVVEVGKILSYDPNSGMARIQIGVRNAYQN